MAALGKELATFSPLSLSLSRGAKIDHAARFFDQAIRFGWALCPFFSSFLLRDVQDLQVAATLKRSGAVLRISLFPFPPLDGPEGVGAGRSGRSETIPQAGSTWLFSLPLFLPLPLCRSGTLRESFNDNQRIFRPIAAG